MAVTVARAVKTHIHESAIVWSTVALGEGSIVEPYAILGGLNAEPRIGEQSVIRAYTRISGRVVIGSWFETGNHALVRGNVKIGDRCKVGSYSSVEGDVEIGDDTIIRGRCEIPNSIIGSRVQIYAGTFFYDTPNPPDGPNLPPVIEDDVILCCDVRVLGGVTVGAGSFVCAGAFVTQDIPPDSYVKRSGEAVPQR